MSENSASKTSEDQTPETSDRPVAWCPRFCVRASMITDLTIKEGEHDEVLDEVREPRLVVRFDESFKPPDSTDGSVLSKGTRFRVLRGEDATEFLVSLQDKNFFDTVGQYERMLSRWKKERESFEQSPLSSND